MSGENQLLVSIQASLMTLLVEVGAVKQSIEHLTTNHDRLRNDMSKLDERIDNVEKKQLINDSSWLGPKTLLSVLAVLAAVVTGVFVLLGKP